jgi:hypothetical protein
MILRTSRPGREVLGSGRQRRYQEHRFVDDNVRPQLENTGRLAESYIWREQGHQQNEWERNASRASCLLVQIQHPSTIVMGIRKN